MLELSWKSTESNTILHFHRPNSNIKTASNLHQLIFTPDIDLSPYDRSVKQRCCNLPLLESIFLNFQDIPQ